MLWGNAADCNNHIGGMWICWTLVLSLYAGSKIWPGRGSLDKGVVQFQESEGFPGHPYAL